MGNHFPSFVLGNGSTLCSCDLSYFGCIGTYGAPITKRSNDATLFHGKNPLQGIKIAGLFNPMERCSLVQVVLIRQHLSPNGLKKREREHGHKLHTYRDICILSRFFGSDIRQASSSDFLMEDHFTTFITDHDLGLLKSAHIDTVRIPVTYTMFLPKENRTANFPKGELKALDK